MNDLFLESDEKVAGLDFFQVFGIRGKAVDDAVHDSRDEQTAEGDSKRDYGLKEYRNKADAKENPVYPSINSIHTPLNTTGGFKCQLA
jgi:hypothetical protein